MNDVERCDECSYTGPDWATVPSSVLINGFNYIHHITTLTILTSFYPLLHPSTYGDVETELVWPDGISPLPGEKCPANIILGVQ